MPFLKFTLPLSAPIAARQALYFYPDVFNYSYDERQYQRAWASVHEEHKGYLIVQKGLLSRVNWFSYTFERIKGWFGFSNACQPEKVTMTAQKLAYYGYLNGYSQKEALDTINSWLNAYKPKPSFTKQCQSLRADLTSEQLQKELLRFYQDHAHDLDALDESFLNRLPLPHLTPNFKFGATYAYFNDARSMAWSDIQEEQLIRTAIKKLGDVDHTLPGSKCRNRYINEKLQNLSITLNNLSPLNSNESKKSQFQEFLTLVQQSFSSTEQKRSSAEVRRTLSQIHQQAHNLLSLEPDLIENHYLLFINLELSSTVYQLTNAPKRTHYQEAFRLMTHYCNEQTTNEYLSAHFVKEDGFASLDMNSEHVKDWAHYLYKKAKSHAVQDTSLCLYRVAQINPNLIIEEHFLQFTIEHALLKKNFSLSHTLIERLFATRPSVALFYLKNNSALHHLLQEDSPLKRAFVQSLVKDAKGWTLFGNGTKDTNFLKAAALDPSVQYQDAAGYFFEQYVTQNKWQEAFNLLNKRRKAGLKDTDLPELSLKALAQHYFDEGNRFYKEGVQVKPDYVVAEKKYRYSSLMMDAAVKVLDCQKYREERNVHKRLLALIIIDGDEIQNTLSLERVLEALTLLEAIQVPTNDEEKSYLDTTFIRVLQPYIALLHQNCLGAEMDKYNEATDEHKNRVTPWLGELMQRIDQLIELYNKSGNRNNAQLASMHFLKAEYIDYFKCDGDAVPHYKKACHLEPGQAFYHLRYAFVIHDSNPTESNEVSERGSKLNKAADLNFMDYWNWFQERWQKEEQKCFKQTMPEPEALDSESSILSLLTRFGFK